jgi:hypothetical protein
MNPASLAEQGKASPPTLPAAAAQQPLSTNLSIPMADIPSRQESTTEVPDSQNGTSRGPFIVEPNANRLQRVVVALVFKSAKLLSLKTVRLYHGTTPFDVFADILQQGVNILQATHS